MIRRDPEARAAAAWRALQASLDGEVVLPGDADYDEARRPAVARFDGFRPQAVVRCRTADDVAAAIGVARRSGLELAVRSGGHCFAGHSSSDGVVLDVGPLTGVTLADGIATIGAGTRLGAIYDALAPHGVTVPAGCGPQVGIAGLALGGGLGVLGRQYGLTSDSLVGARVVLADGRIVDCDAGHEADLFWALRGAGAAGFGVVTSLALRTCPAPRTTTFHVVWPGRAAAGVLAAWQDWAPDGPDELAASLVVTAARDPERPALASVFGAMVGSEGDLGPLLDDLVARVGSDPQWTRHEEAPYRAAKARLSELGATGHGPEDADEGHAYSTSAYVGGRLAPAALAALAERFAAGRVAGQARELDFSPWGGAYGRVPADATAFAHRSDRFLLKQTATVDAAATREERDAARRWLADSTAVVRPAASGRSYQNFPDPELPDPAAAYYGANAPRLRRIKQRYDPERLFRRGSTL